MTIPAKRQTPRVTIVITVFNQADRVGHALESAISQTFDDLEIIIVDDASDDDTQTVCESFAAADTRMRYCRLSQNSGVSVARNRGIDEAHGEWIAFADGDDRLEIDGIEKLLAYPRIDEVQMVLGDYLRIENGIGKVCKSLDLGRTYFDGTDRLLLLSRLLERNGFSVTVWSRIYRTSFLRECGIRFDPDLRRTQDALFNMELIELMPKLGVVHDVVYDYEVYDASTCHKVDPAQREHLERYREATEHFLACHGLYELRDSYCMLCAHLAYEIWTYGGEQNARNLHDICLADPYRWAIPQISPTDLSLKNQLRFILLKCRFYHLLALFYALKHSLRGK